VEVLQTDTPADDDMRQPATEQGVIAETWDQVWALFPYPSHKQLSDAPISADLAAVVAAWPHLPESVRAGIVAMVKAAVPAVAPLDDRVGPPVAWKGGGR
jgi:hypothetical protein